MPSGGSSCPFWARILRGQKDDVFGTIRSFKIAVFLAIFKISVLLISAEKSGGISAGGQVIHNGGGYLYFINIIRMLSNSPL